MTAATYASTQWMDQAVCAQIPEFTELEHFEQKRVCRTCPVEGPCKAFGIDQESPHLGVLYGGLTGRSLAREARLAGRKESDPRRRTGQYALLCTVCGAGFSADTTRALYCSRACQYVAAKRRREVA